MSWVPNVRPKRKYERDLAVQRAKNGGKTDAELYAVEHARALVELYRRAGLELPENIAQEIRAAMQYGKSGL